MELLTIVGLLALIAAVAISKRRKVHRATTVEVVAGEEGVRRVLADGRTEEIHWSEVTEVDVFTTRVGPHRAGGGAVVLYGDAERGCIVPLDLLAESGLMNHVHRLPGFDPATVVDALADPRQEAGVRGAFAPRPLHRTTVCWTRGDP
jgi:hypothetical protein